MKAQVKYFKNTVNIDTAHNGRYCGRKCRFDHTTWDSTCGLFAQLRDWTVVAHEYKFERCPKCRRHELKAR